MTDSDIKVGDYIRIEKSLVHSFTKDGNNVNSRSGKMHKVKIGTMACGDFVVNPETKVCFKVKEPEFQNGRVSVCNWNTEDEVFQFGDLEPSTKEVYDEQESKYFSERMNGIPVEKLMAEVVRRHNNKN